MFIVQFFKLNTGLSNIFVKVPISEYVNEIFIIYDRNIIITKAK